MRYEIKANQKPIESGYEKLEIYRLSKELAIKVHHMTLSLPKFETYEEASQIRRSSKSVPANIVEGYCLRRHVSEYLQYLHRAFASCEETRFHLQILYETGSLTNESLYKELAMQYTQLAKMIFKFICFVNSAHMQPTYTKN